MKIYISYMLIFEGVYLASQSLHSRLHSVGTAGIPEKKHRRSESHNGE